MFFLARGLFGHAARQPRHAVVTQEGDDQVGQPRRHGLVPQVLGDVARVALQQPLREHAHAGEEVQVTTQHGSSRIELVRVTVNS